MRQGRVIAGGKWGLTERCKVRRQKEEGRSPDLPGARAHSAKHFFLLPSDFFSNWRAPLCRCREGGRGGRRRAEGQRGGAGIYRSRRRRWSGAHHRGTDRAVPSKAVRRSGARPAAPTERCPPGRYEAHQRGFRYGLLPERPANGINTLAFMTPIKIWLGYPYPLGATWLGNGVNFAIFSEMAASVDLCLFDSPDARQENIRIPMTEHTDQVWHIFLPDVRPGQLYGFRVFGPYDPGSRPAFQ